MLPFIHPFKVAMKKYDKCSYGYYFRFMTVVKQAVERLETMEISFAPILCHVGARHAPNSKFCSDNFALFMKSMLYIWSTVLKVSIPYSSAQTAKQ